MTKRITLESSFAATDNGLKNVSLITTGIEAAGHGIYLDEKTAETAMKKMLGRSVKSYLRHEGAGGDRLGNEIGFFSGIYRQGEQIKATAFEFLESFKKDSGAIADKIIEMAQKVPDQFGVSLVLEYIPVWVMGDGSEVQASSLSAPAGALRSMPSMRVLDVISADFVGRPAANPNGLLSADAPAAIIAPVDDQPVIKPQTKTLATMSTTATLSVADHETKIAELSALHAGDMIVKNDEIAALAEKLAKATEAKDALTASLASSNEAHKAALEKAVADAVAPIKAELETAKKFDARALGVPPLAVRSLVALEEARLAQLPAPAATDAAKWEQYAALKAESEDKAEKFRAAYLSRK